MKSPATQTTLASRSASPAMAASCSGRRSSATWPIGMKASWEGVWGRCQCLDAVLSMGVDSFFIPFYFFGFLSQHLLAKLEFDTVGAETCESSGGDDRRRRRRRQLQKKRTHLCQVPT